MCLWWSRAESNRRPKYVYFCFNELVLAGANTNIIKKDASQVVKEYEIPNENKTFKDAIRAKGISAKINTAILSMITAKISLVIKVFPYLLCIL